MGHLRVAPSLCFKARREAIDMKIISYSHANKTHFDKKGFALVLKVRVFGTRKWSIKLLLPRSQ